VIERFWKEYQFRIDDYIYQQEWSGKMMIIRNVNIKKWLFGLIIGLFLLASSCTENPFSSPEDIEMAVISGEVEMEEEDQSDVYVFLEGFNLSDVTNEKGKFSIPISSNYQRGTEKSYTGRFRLFFFISDYYLKYIEISFINGQLVENQDLISEKGKIRSKIYLRKLVDVETSFVEEEEEKDTINVKKNSEKEIKCNITYLADTFMSVKIPSNMRVREGTSYFGLLFYPRKNSKDVKIYDSHKYVSSLLNRVVLHSNDPKTIEYKIYPDQFDIEPGFYKVTPYVQIEYPYSIHEELQRRIDSLGDSIKVENKTYHILPNKFDHSIINFTESN
jgi:hypothetical protein